MADNKKYYYLKLKENYFDKDNIKIIESMVNGHTFSLIILKLYLKSCKYEGRLMMTDRIPYNPAKIEILSKVINHDVSHVREAIKIGCDMDLITIIDTDEIWMNDIQTFIGHSSTEADRKRTYRKALMDKCPDNVLITSDKYPPELELKKELKIKKEIKKKKYVFNFEGKEQHLEYVWLKPKQYTTLCTEFGTRMIEGAIYDVNNYMLNKPEKQPNETNMYHDHSAAIRTFLKRDGKEPIPEHLRPADPYKEEKEIAQWKKDEAAGLHTVEEKPPEKTWEEIKKEQAK